MVLSINTLLQGGKYKIEKVLGQGGFGITYLAVQVGLNRKVAIKEFFMKEYCNRDAETSHVSIPSDGSKELVARFRQKFVKEAQTIAGLNHPHIIRIYDVFEENDTAYYVMEYHDNGSLSELVKQHGALPEAEALRYIREVAKALTYIHKRNMNHLDIKPGNILLDEEGCSVLIDFGLSKRYDESGHQTSTTPVGISHGYAPMEQYKQGGVGTFSPATDIYSLGATLYKLLTGQTPPDASDVNDDGLPELSSSISASTRTAVVAAMQPRRKERPQSMAAFLALLDKDPVVADIDDADEDTVIEIDPEPTPKPKPTPAPSKNKWLVPTLIAAIVALIIIFWPKGGSEETIPNPTEEVFVNTNTSATSSDRTFTVNGVSFTMIPVYGGTFQMGFDNGDSDERPVHSVTLSSYSIGETEVTQALWTAVMGSNPSDFKGNNLPVEMVSWNDCLTFIRKLNDLTGENFRLPTEAEWEFAARGGNRSRGYKYSGSDNPGDVAWYTDHKYTDNSGNKTHTVKSKSPNELGIYDMSGNVWEWCSDLYGSYSSSSVTNPKGRSSGSDQVYRGGSWFYDAGCCRVANRYYDTPSYVSRDLGLRLVL